MPSWGFKARMQGKEGDIETGNLVNSLPYHKQNKNMGSG